MTQTKLSAREDFTATFMFFVKHNGRNLIPFSSSPENGDTQFSVLDISLSSYHVLSQKEMMRISEFKSLNSHTEAKGGEIGQKPASPHRFLLAPLL